MEVIYYLSILLIFLFIFTIISTYGENPTSYGEHNLINILFYDLILLFMFNFGIYFAKIISIYYNLFYLVYTNYIKIFLRIKIVNVY